MSVHKTKIGVIGINGKVGKLLETEITGAKEFELGSCFSRSQGSLAEVFSLNDLVIDFSSAHLMGQILNEALSNPKPLIICTTGWDKNIYMPILKTLAQKVPIVIAPNTSFGACVQLFMTKQMAKIFGEDYDIDVLEKHHRHKIDVPSGTSSQLINSIIETKKEKTGLTYAAGELAHGPRPENFIGSGATRSGGVFGEHEVIFTNDYEMLSLKHQAFNRSLFARGALVAAKWLEKNKDRPGIYTMLDVIMARGLGG